MATDSARIGGFVAGAAGLGVLGYFGYPYIARSLAGASVVSVTFQPSQPQASQPWSVTVTAKGTAGALLGLQTMLIQPNGLVGAHLWASAADAQAAYNLYWDTYEGEVAAGTPQGTASADAENAVASLSGEYDQRVATATVGSGGTATATLYAEQLNPGPYTLVVLVAPNPAGLLAQDPIGTSYAAIKRLPVPQAAFSVTVAAAAQSMRVAVAA